MNKKELYTIPGDSTVFYTEPFYYCNCLLYDYDKDDGIVVRSGIRFFSPLAMRKRGERCQTAWHWDHAWKTLFEIEDSTWLQEILSDVPDRYKNPRDKYNATNCKHYMIFLDNKCFEVIAQGWDILPEQEGVWGQIFPDNKQFFA